MISAAEKKAEKAAQPCAAPAMEKKAPEKEKPKAISATGELVSVDAKAGMLAVKVKDKEMSFTAETKAARQALEKVKIGDRVTVSYTEKDGKMMASSIKAAKAKKAEKKEGMMEEKKEKKKEKM
jgi:ribosomal protein S1